MILLYSVISLLPYGEKKIDKVKLGFMFLDFEGDQNEVEIKLQSVESIQLLSLYLFTKNGNIRTKSKF